MPLCAREDIAILPYFPLASGFLTGKYRSSADKTQERARRRRRQASRRQGQAVLAALDAVAARHGATCAQVALAWIMAKPAIAAPIASATSVAQITELMGALELTLTAARRRRARRGERMRASRRRCVAAVLCARAVRRASAEQRNPFETRRGGHPHRLGAVREIAARSAMDPTPKVKLGPDLTQRWARGESDESAFQHHPQRRAGQQHAAEHRA